MRRRRAALCRVIWAVAIAVATDRTAARGLIRGMADRAITRSRRHHHGRGMSRAAVAGVVFTMLGVAVATHATTAMTAMEGQGPMRFGMRTGMVEVEAGMIRGRRGCIRRRVGIRRTTRRRHRQQPGITPGIRRRIHRRLRRPTDIRGRTHHRRHRKWREFMGETGLAVFALLFFTDVLVLAC